MARTVVNFSRPGLLRGIPARLYGNFGRTRSVQEFSRPGLLRGIPARLYGSFARVTGAQSNQTSSVRPRGSVSAGKVSSVNVTGRFGYSTQLTGVSTSLNAIFARGRLFGASTGSKTAQSADSPRLIFRASITSTTVPLFSAQARASFRVATTATKIRTVGAYSRPSLLRGVPQRRYGSFSRTVLASTNVVGLVPLFSTHAPLKIGHGAVAARFYASGVTTRTKIGATAVAGFAAGLGTPAATKRGQSDEAGLFHARGLATYSLLSGRAVLRFAAPSLYLVPARTYGSFARIPGSNVLPRTLFAAVTTTAHIGTFGVAGLVAPAAAITTAKTGPTAIAGWAAFSARTAAVALLSGARTHFLGAATYARTSTAAMAARLSMLGAVTVTSLQPPTVNLSASLHLLGASTATRLLNALGGRLHFRADVQPMKIGHGEILARLLGLGASTAAKLGIGSGSGWLRLRGAMPTFTGAGQAWYGVWIGPGLQASWLDPTYDVQGDETDWDLGYRQPEASVDY